MTLTGSAVMSDQKTCSRCQKTLPRIAFHRSRKARDGLQHRCKTCKHELAQLRYAAKAPEICAQTRSYRRSLGEAIREKGRERYRQKAAEKARYQTIYRATNKHKIDARRAVASAVRAGKLRAPETCSRCGRKARRIVAHHDSYEPAKWLDVHWVCDPCHMGIHANHDRVHCG